MILGFLFGVVSSLITSSPRVQNWFSGLAKVYAHSCEYTRTGGAVTNIRFHYEIINGHEVPLVFYNVFLEFNTNEIQGNSLGATSLLEVIHRPVGKWFILDGETTVNHRQKSSTDVSHNGLLPQITNRKKLKYRLCLGTSRYGVIKSEWKPLAVTNE